MDSTSVGTLVVPVLLRLTAATVRHTFHYLLVIGVFYWMLGVALTAGALPLFERFGDALGSAPAMAVYADTGVLLVVWSYRIDPAAIRKRGGDPEEGARRWLDRVHDAGGSVRALTGLALLAGVVEAATMVPYLAAIGVIVDSGAGLGRSAVTLVGYCALMLVPGSLIAVVRAVAGSRVDTVLTRIRDRSVRHAASTVSWTVGIVGVLIVLNTAPAVLQNL